MSIELEKIVDFLKQEQFLKIINTEVFPELSQETKKILKNYGLPSIGRGSYPRIVTDGTLKRFTSNLIEVGIFP